MFIYIYIMPTVASLLSTFVLWQMYIQFFASFPIMILFHANGCRSLLLLAGTVVYHKINVIRLSSILIRCSNHLSTFCNWFSDSGVPNPAFSSYTPHFLKYFISIAWVSIFGRLDNTDLSHPYLKIALIRFYKHFCFLRLLLTDWCTVKLIVQS